MNLVAKEFVAARDDEQGVLLLSRFAGAARELSGAIVVNPYDIDNVADAMANALTLPGDDQARRMRAHARGTWPSTTCSMGGRPANGCGGCACGPGGGGFHRRNRMKPGPKILS